MNLLSSKLYIILYLFFISFKAQSFQLKNVILQYAGDIGKFSIGTGGEINNYYTISVHYGYVPATAIQSKIETYTIKNNLMILYYSYKIIGYKLYTGLSFYHIPGNKYKTDEYNATPNNYYRQSSIRAQIYLGHELTYKTKNTIFVESGVNDIWIINSLNNDSVNYQDHITLGIGYKYIF